MTKRELYFMRYEEQRKNARGRRIEFIFLFDEWVAWWEEQLGPNWFKLRGRHTGQYHMARFKDEGPYTSWNVYCALGTENCVHKGELNGFAKLTAASVKQIYLAVGKLETIGGKYGVSLHTVWDIKTGRYWGHITAKLGVAPMYHNVKLTKEEVVEIYLSKETSRSLMKKYSVGRSTIYTIWNGLSWREITQKYRRVSSSRKVV